MSVAEWSAALPIRARAATDFTDGVVGLLAPLEHYARRLGNQDAEVKDLVQETCLRALEAHASFARGSNLQGWLFRILHNLHYDNLRRAGHEVRFFDERTAPPAPQPAERPPAWTTV